MKKTVRAFLCAPLAPALLLSLLTWHPVALLFAVPVAYFGMGFFGLPLYLLARHYGRVSLPACVLGSALTGALVYQVGCWWANAVAATLAYGIGMAAFATLGVIAGISFWFIGSGRRAAGPALTR